MMEGVGNSSSIYTSNVSANMSYNVNNYNKELQIFMTWASITEVTGILVFNTIVLVLLVLRKKNSRMAYFVRNLAVGDLFVGLVYVLPEIIVYHFHVGWNSSACYFFYSVRMFPVYASTFAILVLALDRLYVVIKPIQSATNGQKYKIVALAFPWVLAAALSIPYCVLVAFKDGTCYFKISGFGLKAMLIYDISVNVVIPVAIIGSCYSIILFTICKRQQHKLLLECSSFNTHHNRCTTTNESLLNVTSDFFTKAKIKTIKLLFAVVAAYIICWTPICIATILLTWQVIPYGSVYKVLYTLAPLNSLVNPILFLLFNFQTFCCPPLSNRRDVTVSRTTFASYKVHTSKIYIECLRTSNA